MSADADVILLKGIIKQLNGKIDFDLLAKDIGVKDSRAARNRWDNYRRKHFTGGEPISSIKGPNATPKKTSNGKTKKDRLIKKRKAMWSDEEEEDDEDGEDDEDNWEKETEEEVDQFDTPSKRKNSRVSKAKTEALVDEDEEEDAFYGMDDEDA